MRLTIQQRLQALERESTVLHDTIKILHKLVKEQGTLINEFIVQNVADVNISDAHRNGNNQPESELYTFVCQRRFDKIEQDIRTICKPAEDKGFGLKAG